ncbi:hypothetical protein [Sinorhizobium medicae]|uniref:hypothetical protein n=1 Tax=Sinorhizobium medicae TaxID=110321 RepID=UPI000C7CAE77|nr:hypothetical protein [Sinorhizobium medicae]MDX0911861.1 hypothetical protein [Sinorhizobium medicae]PLU46571.1 hypothetical protein BMJ25_19975 [Sinorhizobium medicae]RVK23722.1 hypothetical protein CN165_01950 [Sinorhizobium medicae]
MSTLTSIDYWRLADRLSVVDAAILISGNDPSRSHSVHDPTFGEDYSFLVQTTTGHRGFEPTFKALKNAILSDRLAAALAFPAAVASVDFAQSSLKVVKLAAADVFRMRGLGLSQHDEVFVLQSEPDWSRTTIDVGDLKAWLESKHVFPDFFFPKGDPEDFMNKDHARYSSKLACAVAAWKAITQPAPSRTVKQTINAWVKENGAKYDRDRNAEFSNQASDEIATVANWDPGGGAPRTGGQVTGTTHQVKPLRSNYEPMKPERQRVALDDDSEPPGL